MDRLPSWLRAVLTIEEGRRWRLLAAQGHNGVVSGAAALVVHLRHRVCARLVWASGALLRPPEVAAGLAVASVDDAVVDVLVGFGDADGGDAHAADDLREVELRTPLRMEEALILVGLRYPDVDLERIAGSLPVSGYWDGRRPEVLASLRTRGFVQRSVREGLPLGVRVPALTLGSAGRVWVEPHRRDGRIVAGYWRRR